MGGPRRRGVCECPRGPGSGNRSRLLRPVSVQNPAVSLQLSSGDCGAALARGVTPSSLRRVLRLAPTVPRFGPHASPTAQALLWLPPHLPPSLGEVSCLSPGTPVLSTPAPPAFMASNAIYTLPTAGTHPDAVVPAARHFHLLIYSAPQTAGLPPAPVSRTLTPTVACSVTDTLLF